MGNHCEVVPLNERGSGLRPWLVREYLVRHGRPANSTALASVMEALAAQAVTSATHDVHLRVAQSEGAIYLDLANDAWEVVQVDAAGKPLGDAAPAQVARLGLLAADCLTRACGRALYEAKALGQAPGEAPNFRDS